MKKSKAKWVATMSMFWYDQAGYQFDYPSLEFIFVDDSTMKMFISPWWWEDMGIYVPKVSFTYEDTEHVYETPGYAPAANQNGKLVETYMGEWIDWLKNHGIDITAMKTKVETWNCLTK